MAVVYMAPDAVEAVARRIADVASELEERAAVIDGLLDEAGTWSGTVVLAVADGVVDFQRGDWGGVTSNVAAGV